MGNLSRKDCIFLVSAILLLNSSGYSYCAEEDGVDSGQSSNSTSETTRTEVTKTTPPVEVSETLLTDEEQEKLINFREKMLPEMPHDYMKTDDYLVRWLRARDWDIEGAEQMLRDNLKWREEEDMDNIENFDWSDMIDTYPYTKDTVDKMGRPIGTMNIGQWDIRAASYAGKMQRLYKYTNKLLEEATQGVYTKRQQGINVTQWKVLMNMDGFGLRMHACPSCLSFYQAFMSSYENHYPGYADAFVIINTPTTFRIVKEVIKPFLSGETKKIMKIYGRNEKTWKEYLDQEIESSQRRPEFGGTLQDAEDNTESNLQFL